MTPRTATLLSSLLLLCAASPSLAAAERAPAFIRCSDDGRTLQSAIRRYVHPARASVTIVATVHVGTDGYYRLLSSKANASDCVLVEGVTRRATDAWRGGSHDYAAALGLVRQGQALKLAARGDVINADLDGTAFDRVLAATAHAMPPIAASPRSRAELAAGLVALAEDPATLAATEEAYAIAARHEVVMRALRHRLARGDASIALVYGVAHGPDLHARLLTLGFAAQATEWVDAFGIE